MSTECCTFKGFATIFTLLSIGIIVIILHDLLMDLRDIPGMFALFGEDGLVR